MIPVIPRPDWWPAETKARAYMVWEVDCPTCGHLTHHLPDMLPTHCPDCETEIEL